MSAVSDRLTHYLANAYGAVGAIGAVLFSSVSAAAEKLAPELGEGATHEQVIDAAYRFVRENPPAAASAKPTVVTPEAFRGRYNADPSEFEPSTRIALTRALASSLGVETPPSVAQRQRIAPVTREQLQAHFGAATNLDDLPARAKLAACNSITAARAKAPAA